MKPSHPISRSTSCRKQRGLHLNAFRGVRAISEFDWPFTPTLTSSRSFSTLIGSALRDYFTPLRAVLFTFPSRYWFTIGLSRVFSLGGWARRIHTGFHVSRATQDTATMKEASCKGLSPAMAALSSAFHSLLLLDVAVLQPRRGRNRSGLGSSPFARHY